jgi:tetratricopeptide (TPR) repeat protein
MSYTPIVENKAFTMPNLSPAYGLQRTYRDSNLLHLLHNGDFYDVLTSPRAQSLLEEGLAGNFLRSSQDSWKGFILRQTEHILNTTSSEDFQAAKQELGLIGVAALHAFLQSNVTGPPLQWSPDRVIFPKALQEKRDSIRKIQSELIGSLTVDGEAAYRLTPHVELFCLAKIILNHPLIAEHDDHARWEKIRVNFWHQRMLSEIAPSLQQAIYDDLQYLATVILPQAPSLTATAVVKFLLERAAIHTHHGFDRKAREDLDHATRLTGLEYVLTGRLGKRTKFQENELSQLVVLARSASDEISEDKISPPVTDGSKPQTLDLNDDTLLESIAFSKASPGVQATQDESLPPSLASLDPANQPILEPLDSIILLSLASSITNTSPQHGLTREETLPYATRVLDGGSTNWQIYTQALLVRSRIEGYRTRTVERGVLQLQALVDQIIAETTSANASGESSETSDGAGSAMSTTFLPRPKASESAPVSERLKYIHQLATPTRWTLEAELASRWVSIGGLRTALEIYERLEMWAEAALCWAAVDREDKACEIVRRQLYRSKLSEKSSESPDSIMADDNEDVCLEEERSPLPTDAPRLFCILGDIEKSPILYERAWTVSGNRYARAQRSLGKHYLTAKDLRKADEAYAKSLKINPQNQRAWFALGCVRLELRDWRGAVDAFSRTVQLEEEDAEAWSNLAAALLRLPPDEPKTCPGKYAGDADVQTQSPSHNHTTEAFVALKRAAALKRDSYRIWQNLLNVAGTLSPPPYADIITAQERLIELRGSIEGEGCVDVEVIEGLLAHVIASDGDDEESATSIAEQRRKKYGLDHMLTDLIQKRVVPLITHSRRLWQLVARLYLHLKRPSSALDAYEKAWRATQNRPGWESGLDSTNEAEGGDTPEKPWTSVVDGTIDLVDAYESLGELERTEGLAAGSGELVCKQWRFKSRSAIRGVMGKAKDRWEGSEGWNRLEGRLDLLSSA